VQQHTTAPRCQQPCAVSYNAAVLRVPPACQCECCSGATAACKSSRRCQQHSAGKVQCCRAVKSFSPACKGKCRSGATEARKSHRCQLHVQVITLQGRRQRRECRISTFALRSNKPCRRTCCFGRYANIAVARFLCTATRSKRCLPCMLSMLLLLLQVC
jgi:hypothetical protein